MENDGLIGNTMSALGAVAPKTMAPAATSPQQQQTQGHSALSPQQFGEQGGGEAAGGAVGELGEVAELAL